VAFGVSRTTASNLERGRQRVFLDQLYRAAIVLKIPPSDLLPRIDLETAKTEVITAADDPLSASAVRSLTKVVRELETPTRSTLRKGRD
jgi:transcriptional regulator with XRE-family HTH domain